MGISFPGESTEYRAARDRLLSMETDLRRAMEAVAVARRALPPGGVVPAEYVFRGLRSDGAEGDVRFSELFDEGIDSLAIYTFMFPRDASDDRPGPRNGATARLALAEGPCPSCTALIDQLDGAVEHVRPRVGLVVVAQAPFDRLRAFQTERGWSRIKLYSAASNTYNRDYHGQSESGAPQPVLNVFHRQNGEIRHFWASELLYAPAEPGQDPRHVGTLEPMWNLFDLTPEGRGDWNEQLDYGCCKR